MAGECSCIRLTAQRQATNDVRVYRSGISVLPLLPTRDVFAPAKPFSAVV